jgi:2-polyprenyl-3-methyl-5-hydroxy-6-metoxy-1,4-benzoquinol methylase
MTTELEAQRDYWDRESGAFDTIYGSGKDSVPSLLDRVFRKDMYQRFEFTLEHSMPIEGRTFLDVGCGSGVYSVALAERGARHVTGIDIAPSMLELCWQRAERHAVADRCSFVESDLLAFTPEAQFDVTIGIGLFDYIRDPSPVLTAMRRVTVGCAILSFPRFWTWRAPIRKVRLSLRKCSVYFYTRRRLTRLLRDAGFGSVRIEKVGKLHCVVAS